MDKICKDCSKSFPFLLQVREHTLLFLCLNLLMKILDLEQPHITIVALQEARFSGPGKI